MHRSIKEKRAADKIKAIVLLKKGYTYEQVAEVLLIDERTIARYKAAYENKGVEELLVVNFVGRAFRLTEEQIRVLQNELESRIYNTAAEVCKFVNSKFGIFYKTESMVQFLKKLGYTYKKIKASPGKHDPAKQRAFIEQYEELRNSLSDNEKVYFVDSSHPTHNMMPGYAWIKKGDDRFERSNPGRKHLNLVGGFCPQDQGMLVKEYQTVDADSILDFFKALEKKEKTASKVYVILDNARYHHAKYLREYLETSKLELVFLPPYSPNLNLIERLWRFFQEQIMKNKYYETFEEFKNVSLQFFRQRSGPIKRKLQTLMTERFQLFPMAP
jgi:transposase